MRLGMRLDREDRTQRPLPGGRARAFRVARVAFSIDRTSDLTEEGLLHSSGVPELNRAAPDLTGQSLPFPAPPAQMAERDLSFGAPIRDLGWPLR